MSEIELLFSASEIETLRRLYAGTWHHYAIPLKNPQFDFGLVDIALRTSDEIVALHIEDGDRESSELSYLKVDRDSRCEQKAIEFGGTFSLFKNQAMRRHNQKDQ